MWPAATDALPLAALRLALLSLGWPYPPSQPAAPTRRTTLQRGSQVRRRAFCGGRRAVPRPDRVQAAVGRQLRVRLRDPRECGRLALTDRPIAEGPAAFAKLSGSRFVAPVCAASRRARVRPTQQCRPKLTVMLRVASCAALQQLLLRCNMVYRLTGAGRGCRFGARRHGSVAPSAQGQTRDELARLCARLASLHRRECVSSEERLNRITAAPPLACLLQARRE